MGKKLGSGAFGECYLGKSRFRVFKADSTIVSVLFSDSNIL